jgi:hypothetical protein
MNPGKSAKVDWVPLNQLILYPKNARTHSETNVAKLARSLEEYGWTNPVLITGASEVIAGHGRILAARKLEMESAPCLRITHLSPAQIKAYRLADNRTALDSDWNMELLAAELRDIGETGEIDLSLTGFEQSELDQFLLDRNGENDPNAEWQGMPEFNQPDATAFRAITVNFKDQGAIEEFSRKIGQNITDNTRSIWYPPAEIGRIVDKHYTTESE